MLEMVDIGRPIDVFRVLRTDDHEFVVRQQPRWREQQTLEHRLTIDTVGAHVSQAPFDLTLQRRVRVGVDCTIQRSRPRAAVEVLDQLQDRPTREGQIKTKARNERGIDVFGAASFQSAERDRRINVVEGSDAARGAGDPVAHNYAIRHEGAEDDHVRILHQRSMTLRQAFEAVVDLDPAVRPVLQVAVFAVPGAVALEKGHPVAARRERLDKRAIGGGMAISPGGGQRQPEDRDVEFHAAASLPVVASWSTSITCRARCRYVWADSMRARAAWPRRRARASSSAQRVPATSSPSAAQRISLPGVRNSSLPSQASVIMQAPAPAASKMRVGGEKP